MKNSKTLLKGTIITRLQSSVTTESCKQIMVRDVLSVIFSNCSCRHVSKLFYIQKDVRGPHTRRSKLSVYKSLNLIILFCIYYMQSGL